jgi:hypothetical protein
LSASKRARYSNSESSPDPDLGFNEGTAVIDAVPEIEVLPKSPPVSHSFSGQRRKVPCALKDYIPHSLVGLPSHLRPAPPKPTLPAGPEVLSPASPSDPEPEPVADTRFTTEPNCYDPGPPNFHFPPAPLQTTTAPPAPIKPPRAQTPV